MKESYRKGVATILTPSHARAHRKGALEALEKKHLAEPPNRGVRKLGQGHMQAGYPEIVSSEIAEIREPTASSSAEGNTELRVNASATGPAESKTPCMHRNFTRENREAPWPSLVGRTGNAGRRRGAI